MNEPPRRSDTDELRPTTVAPVSTLTSNPCREGLVRAFRGRLPRDFVFNREKALNRDDGTLRSPFTLPT